jgi:DNA-directed RNA polymerase specialized sigma subunit
MSDISTALDQLPRTSQDLIACIYYPEFGLSVDETAEVLGIDPADAHRLHREAIEALHNIMTGTGEKT